MDIFVFAILRRSCYFVNCYNFFFILESECKDNEMAIEYIIFAVLSSTTATTLDIELEGALAPNAVKFDKYGYLIIVPVIASEKKQ